MMNKVKYYLLIFISFCFYNPYKAQDYQQALIEEAADSVEAVFYRLQFAKNDNEKYKLNGYIKSYVDFLLHEDEKFQLKLDTLGNLSVVESPNGKLRVITWNLFLDDGSYKYFGFLHYKDGKKLEIFQLEDFSNDTSSLRKFNSHKEWYGALYYDIIEKKWNKKTYYILLGWDGADMLINRKVIESLEFSRKNLPEFGIKIFVDDRAKKERLIFEYAESASMMLQYNPKHDIIVFNHLIPLDPRFKEVSHYYGPDFSYDALEFRMGKWYLLENIDPDKALNFEKNKHINNLKKRGTSKDF
jgi:hypothetical protein